MTQLTTPPTQSLEFIGPREILTSSQLVERLVAEGYSRVNARQILSRLGKKGILWRSEQFRLPAGERLYARAAFWGTEEFCRKAAALVAQTSRQGVARCLAAVGNHDAVLPIQARKLLATPVGANKARYPAYAAELGALKELGVAVLQEGTPLEHLVRGQFTNFDASTKALQTSLAQLKVECLLARVLVNYFRRQNIMVWNRYELPSLEKGYTEFNGQLFTALGYSYLDPVVRWTEEGQKACPVLIDVHGGQCGQFEVESFLQRIARATHRGKSRFPSLGVVAAKGFTEEAWKHARTHRLLTINLRQMFGDEALEAMILVEELLGRLNPDQSASSTDKELAQIVDLLDELKANPVVVTIRSIAFEALTCSAVQADGYEQVGLGKNVPFGDTTRDVDVYGSLADTVRVIECKACHSEKQLTSSEVKKFFTETVPAYLKWLGKRDEYPKHCLAEIWTTGKVGDEARAELAKLKLATIIEPHLHDGEAIKGKLPSKLKVRGEMLLNSIALCQPPNEND